MTTFQVTVSLPDDLRQQAESIGLLMPQAIEQLLREEIRRRKINQFFEAIDQVAKIDLPRLTDDEIAAEIESARRSKNT